MQSEFACHIGLRGKYFCRACWVKGSDGLDEVEAEPDPPGGVPGQQSNADSRVGSEAGSDAGGSEAGSSEAGASEAAGSDASQHSTDVVENSGKTQSKGRRFKETLEQMMIRAKAFVKVCIYRNLVGSVLKYSQIANLRTKKETTEKLRSYFDEASTLNTKTKIRDMRTASGVKDTFQMVFLEKLFNSYKNKRGKKARQEALDAQVNSLPKNTTSPVWRIEGDFKLTNCRLSDSDPNHDRARSTSRYSCRNLACHLAGIRQISVAGSHPEPTENQRRKENPAKNPPQFF